jgi:general secretion pathway protein G
MQNSSFDRTEKKINMRTLSGSQGFTLIELMVVIVILSVLAVWVAPKIMGRPEQAKQVKAKVDIQSFETALKLYRLDNGSYPTTEQGLEALVTQPDTGKLAKNWRAGGYIEKGKIAKDPWGNDFVYISPGVHGEFDIISYGADGEPGGEEYNQDINSWEIE